MAHIKQIWFNDGNGAENKMRVYVALKPTGEAQIIVPLPSNFYAVIMDIAQKAADGQEALMRAEILADNATKG